MERGPGGEVRSDLRKGAPLSEVEGPAEGPAKRQAAPPDSHTPPLHRSPMERGPGGEVPLSSVEARTAHRGPPGADPVRRWPPLMRELRDAWPVPRERPPLSLWAALIDTESGGRPDVISVAGAVGLGQVMPSGFAGYSARLRRMFRDRPTTAALLDPRTNLEWSLRILVTLGYRRCRSWPAALMAYFTGRCDAPTATDATGTSGAHYVRLILARQQRYRDLDAPPPPPTAGDSDVSRRVDALTDDLQQLRARVAQNNARIRGIGRAAVDG